MFTIQFSPASADDLHQLRRYDQQRIVSDIEGQLTYQPDLETRNRKRLKPNPLAEWELRIGPFRVFYDIDAATAVVSIAAVGEKRGSRLFIRGKEYSL